MRGYTSVLSLVTLCCLAELVRADILTGLEEHLKAVTVTQEKGVIEEALDYVSSLGKMKSFCLSGLSKEKIRHNLDAIQQVQTDKSTCGSEKMSDQLASISAFLEHLKDNSPLKPAILKVFEERFEDCAGKITKMEYRNKYIETVGEFVEKVAEGVVGLCDAKVRLESLWQYTCLTHIDVFDVDKFAPSFLEALMRIKSTSAVRKLTNGLKDKSQAISSLGDLISSEFVAACLRMNSYLSSDNLDGEMYFIRNLMNLRQIIGKEFNPDVAELMKKAEGADSLCSIYEPEMKKKLAEKMFALAQF